MRPLASSLGVNFQYRFLDNRITGDIHRREKQAHLTIRLAAIGKFDGVTGSLKVTGTVFHDVAILILNTMTHLGIDQGIQRLYFPRPG